MCFSLDYKYPLVLFSVTHLRHSTWLFMVTHSCVQLEIHVTLCIIVLIADFDTDELWGSRLVGDARFIDSSSGSCSKFLCPHPEGQLDWRFYMPDHRLLLAARAHPSIRWVPELIHTESWHLQHPWHHCFVGLSCLALGTSFPLGRGLPCRE